MKSLLTMIAACLLTSPAWAGVVTYNFTGTVTQAANTAFYRAPVTVGQDIPISISVDTSFPANGSQSYPGSYNPVTGLSPNGIILSATFAGLNEDGLFQSVNATSTSISFFSATPMTGFGFSLSLSGAATGTLQPGVLPSSLDASQFSNRTFSVLNLFDLQSGGFSGTVDPFTIVPEPASMAVIGVGLLGSAMSRRRRKWDQDRESGSNT